MPVYYGWQDREARIVVYELVGAWTWSEYHRGMRATALWFLSEPRRRIDVILDFHVTAVIPEDFLARAHVYARWQPNNLVRVVMIARNARVEHVLSLAAEMKVLPPPLYCRASSLEQALEIIHQSRSGNAM
jgi:hypothetical protein